MDLPAIRKKWGQMLVGQPAVIESVMPFLETYRAGLSLEGRPVGVFLLAGQTGTGKTWAVQSLAKCLHGSTENLLRIDCGEYQLDHEVAKLIGAPPGYLGHRETHPRLSQHKVNSCASERSGISIVLFDEIEKAADAMMRILLGVLDTARLHNGDNTVVSFERTLIFMTTNLGAAEMERSQDGGIGFESRDRARSGDLAVAAQIKKRLSPEFRNRIDKIITTNPVSAQDAETIMDREIERLGEHYIRRSITGSPRLRVSHGARVAILAEGFSRTYGMRQLKRALFHRVLVPVARMVNDGAVTDDAGEIWVDVSSDGTYFAEIAGSCRK
jgi:ATP-dependent Clp protease ATP-binding subunit ClpA